MSLFLYQARTAKGELQKGRFEGANSTELADHLLAAGLIPVDIRALPDPVEFNLGEVDVVDEDIVAGVGAVTENLGGPAGQQRLAEDGHHTASPCGS